MTWGMQLDIRKGVFANQLKTTVGETRAYKITTESGEVVDATFGGASALKRIVNSYNMEGSTARLLMWMDREAVRMYES